MNDDARRERQEREIAAAWREAATHDEAEAPRPALDARILGAARTAARTRSRHRARRLAPLALAASVLVAVGLGLHQQRAVAPSAMMKKEAAPEKSVVPAAASSAEREAEPALDLDGAVESAPLRAEQQRALPPPAGAAKAPSAARAPVLEQRAKSSAARASTDAQASDAAPEVAVPDVVLEIRALLARGERAAAARRARDYLARTPPPPPLPADLEFLLAP